jgi:hypothetical protein
LLENDPSWQRKKLLIDSCDGAIMKKAARRGEATLGMIALIGKGPHMAQNRSWNKLFGCCWSN